MLEWSYAEQEDLRELGKKSPKDIESRVRDKFGTQIIECANDRVTSAHVSSAHTTIAATSSAKVGGRTWSRLTART